MKAAKTYREPENAQANSTLKRLYVDLRQGLEEAIAFGKGERTANRYLWDGHKLIAKGVSCTKRKYARICGTHGKHPAERMEKMRKRIKRHAQNSGLPYYDRRVRAWRLDTAHGTETGSLVYVACELLRKSLYYPFDAGERTYVDFEPHHHEFDQLLAEILLDPEHFTVEGREEYYSKQELELIYSFRRKIMEMKQALIEQ